MEIARGIAGDPPWPELFATLASAGEPCELVVETGAQVHRVAFADQAVVAASSPLASDSALRVMRTMGVITPAMMPTVASRIAAMPSADPIEVLAAVAQLPAETALLMRRRAIAVAATRVFALSSGSFRASHEITLPIKRGTAIDVRALIYEGVRTHLTDAQLAGTVAPHGTSFVLRPEVCDDLPQFGFSPAEMPVLAALRGGATLADLARHHPEVGARGVNAIVTALLAARALDPAPLPRASGQHPAQPLARSSDQLPVQRATAQRTTGQFSTQVPVTGRFAARTGTTGSFAAQAPSLELTDEPRASSQGIYELAEQPRSRTSATFAAVDEPADALELAEPPRSFTTKPPTTGVFAVRAERPSTPPIAVDPTPPKRATGPQPALRPSGDYSITLRPARSTQQGPAVSPPVDDAKQHYDRGMALLDRDLEKATAELRTAARLSGDVDHEAMHAWAQFCAATNKESVAKATKTALAKAVYQSTTPSLAHFYLGRMERMLGRDREALAHFKTVVDQVPRHAEALAEIRMLEARLPKKK